MASSQILSMQQFGGDSFNTQPNQYSGGMFEFKGLQIPSFNMPPMMDSGGFAPQTGFNTESGFQTQSAPGLNPDFMNNMIPTTPFVFYATSVDTAPVADEPTPEPRQVTKTRDVQVLGKSQKRQSKRALGCC